MPSPNLSSVDSIRSQGILHLLWFDAHEFSLPFPLKGCGGFCIYDGVAQYRLAFFSGCSLSRSISKLSTSVRCAAPAGLLDSTGRMEWSHTHFDGYELLAVPLESPASIVVLDSSALVLVQRLLLPEGDCAPRSLTWQPGGARTGCSSGALSCIVSNAGVCTRVCISLGSSLRMTCRTTRLSERTSVHEDLLVRTRASMNANA